MGKAGSPEFHVRVVRYNARVWRLRLVLAGLLFLVILVCGYVLGRQHALGDLADALHERDGLQQELLDARFQVDDLRNELSSLSVSLTVDQKANHDVHRQADRQTAQLVA